MFEIIQHNIVLVATTLSAITAIILFGKKPYEWLKKRYNFRSRLYDLLPKLEKVVTEFQPNGGSTMRDVMDRVEATVQSALEHHWVSYEMDSRGIFEVDSKGQKCRVNKAWCNMTGISQEDAINGYGWINGIALDDRDRVRHEWEMAIRENRTSEIEYSTALGIKVLAVATVLRNKQTGATLGWLGTLTPID